MPKTKHRKTLENLFIAPNKTPAIKYAERVNKMEGFKFFRINKLHLAKKQISHVHGWKTWTGS